MLESIYTYMDCCICNDYCICNVCITDCYSGSHVFIVDSDCKFSCSQSSTYINNLPKMFFQAHPSKQGPLEMILRPFHSMQKDGQRCEQYKSQSRDHDIHCGKIDCIWCHIHRTSSHRPLRMSSVGILSSSLDAFIKTSKGLSPFSFSDVPPCELHQLLHLYKGNKYGSCNGICRGSNQSVIFTDSLYMRSQEDMQAHRGLHHEETKRSW